MKFKYLSNYTLYGSYTPITPAFDKLHRGYEN